MRETFEGYSEPNDGIEPKLIEAVPRTLCRNLQRDLDGQLVSFWSESMHVLDGPEGGINCPDCLVHLDGLMEQGQLFTWRPLGKGRRTDPRTYVSTFEAPFFMNENNGYEQLWWLARRGTWDSSYRRDPFDARLPILSAYLPGLKFPELEHALRARTRFTVRMPYNDITLREVDPGWFWLLRYPAPCRCEGSRLYEREVLAPVP